MRCIFSDFRIWRRVKKPHPCLVTAHPGHAHKAPATPSCETVRPAPSADAFGRRKEPAASRNLESLRHASTSAENCTGEILGGRPSRFTISRIGAGQGSGTASNCCDTVATAFVRICALPCHFAPSAGFCETRIIANGHAVVAHVCVKSSIRADGFDPLRRHTKPRLASGGGSPTLPLCVASCS